MKRITMTLEDSLVFLRWVLAVAAVFVAALILTMIHATQIAQDRNHQTGLENNTYLRTEACILSVPLATRTTDYIQNCYLRAEQATGVQVDHFGAQ